MQSLKRLKYLTNGEWKESKTEKYMPVTDSSTGKVIAEAACCTTEEVYEAIAAAKAAYPEWSKLPIIQRVQVMYKFKALVQENYEELALLIATEHGKMMSEARGEVESVIEGIELACTLPMTIQGEYMFNVSGDHDCFQYREPMGVFVGIGPSNFPAMIPWGWMIPLCITCGNTFVLKAASLVPLTGIRLLELLVEAGLPAGVVNYITCSRNEADLVLTHPDVAGVSYVGSTKVGKHIYSTAAAHGKRVQALCEAKNHGLVLKDAHMEITAHRIILSAFGCAGQRCMALPVIVAEEEIADELVSLLVKYAKELKVGPAYKECTLLGPVVSAQARGEVIAGIEKGIAEGAQLVLDGRSVVVEGCENGYFVGPTIFDHVKPGMTVGDEEIFGPIIFVKRVKDFEEGLSLANTSRLGNGAVIFTNNGYRAREFVSRSEAGMIGVNVGIPASRSWFPFSGHKNSFFGDLHAKGKDGIMFFTQSKTVTTKWFSGNEPVTGFAPKEVVKCGE